MDSYSFYGGKQGYNFVLTRSFSSVDDMVTEFRKGLQYTEVNFGEYVLINTPNINNEDNGRLFRRGHNYNDTLGGAEYIGTIVGPAGKTPNLVLETINEVKSYRDKEGYDTLYSEGEYNVTSGSLMPGKNNDGTYNDAIKWASCSVKMVDGQETTVYLGFSFPYFVSDFSADSVSPYYNRNSQEANFTNTNLVNRIDDERHPFYGAWNIKIPRGIKGDTSKNFRVIPASESVQDYDGKADDVANNRMILVYDYYKYDKSESGEPVTVYLGDYNTIYNIEVEEDGSLTLQYTHDDEKTYNNIFKWIRSVNLNSTTGHLKIEYNYDEKNGVPTAYETDLSWVNSIKVSDNGTISIGYTTGENVTLDQKIKWIKNVQITEDGTLTFTYNDESTNIFSKYIKKISNINLETEDESGKEGSGDQRIHVTYNTGETEAIGNPINYIVKTAVTNDYHYLIYYSDPVKRQEIVAQGKNYSYQGLNDWHDLGTLKSESGILIGLNVTVTDANANLLNPDKAIEYLNQTYPNGLQEDLKGKIVTVGDLESKKFYAFDYSLKDNQYAGWYLVGDITSNLSNIVLIERANDPDIETKKDSLDPGGIWFIVED